MKKLTSILLCICIFAILPLQTVKADNEQVSAKSYILMEATTRRVVASKNQDVRMPIASTTKILTALITLEQPNIDGYFTVDPNAIKVEGSSMGLRQGDKVSLNALAKGMLLSSGNDAANASAVRISGSIDKFSVLMNKRAQELGMKNSHFVTPSGLHDEQHYSTAYDMGLLGCAAIQNERFLSICSQKKAKVEFGNPPFPRYLLNHNRLLSEYDGCIGVKTGFTKKAGRCLVSAATRNGVTLVCVTLNASNDWQDHANLLDYGFKQVKPALIPVKVDNIRVNVVGGTQNSIGVLPVDKTYGYISNDDSLTTEVYLDKFCYAPVNKGDIVGEIHHISNGFVVAKTDLMAAQDVSYVMPIKKKNTFLEGIKNFFSSVLK